MSRFIKPAPTILSTHFLTQTLPRVSTEMSLHVLAYNLNRLMSILGISGALEALRA